MSQPRHRDYDRAQTYADRVSAAQADKKHGAMAGDWDPESRVLILTCWCGELFRGIRWEAIGAELDGHIREELDP